MTEAPSSDGILQLPLSCSMLVYVVSVSVAVVVVIDGWQADARDGSLCLFGFTIRD